MSLNEIIEETLLNDIFPRELKRGWLFGNFQNINIFGGWGCTCLTGYNFIKNKDFLLEKSFIYNLRVIINITKNEKLTKCFLKMAWHNY